METLTASKNTVIPLILGFTVYGFSYLWSAEVWNWIIPPLMNPGQE